MPEFVQSAFLAGLAALAIPIVIHLFFRLRTKRVDLGTIRFLRIVLEDRARRRKVMRWLLLALRLACVALLVGLFARPYFSQASVTADKELVVLLIDRSATMTLKGERGRHLDQAIADALEVLRRTGESARVEAAFFDHQVLPIRPPEDSNGATDIGRMIQESASLSPQYGATSYGAAMTWARDILVSAPPGPKQLHLFTDLQRSGLDWTEVAPMPPEVEAHLHNYSRPIVNNVAVTEVKAARTWIRPGDATTVSATVLHGGAFAVEGIPLVLEIGRLPDETPDWKVPVAERRVDFASISGRITQRERVTLEPGGSTTIEFEVPALSEGNWQGRVFLEYDDDLAFDNQQYFAVSATPAYRVLVVSGQTEDASPLVGETHFLEAALRLATPGESYSQSPFLPELFLYHSNGTLPQLSRYEAVVLADVDQITPADSELIAAYVRSGGRLLIFLGDRTSSENLESLRSAGLSPGTLGPVESTRDVPWRIAGWDRKHPIFQPFNDPQHGDLRKLIFAASQRVAPADDVQVLATLDTGNPLLLEQHVGDGTALWVTVSCGRDWSDWTRTPLYLPIVHQLLGYEVGLTSGGRVRSQTLASVADTGERLSESEESASPKTNKRENEGETVEAAPGVDRLAGFVRVTNPSGRESETESCTPGDFEERFGLKFTEEGAELAADAALVADERQDEFWHWLACAALGVLLFEGFVGNRTTA
jgi:hypothetical protein